MCKHGKTGGGGGGGGGVWGHAPPEKFCNLQPQRLLLVASVTNLMANIRLHCITRILRSFVNFPN